MVTLCSVARTSTSILRTSAARAAGKDEATLIAGAEALVVEGAFGRVEVAEGATVNLNVIDGERIELIADPLGEMYGMTVL